MSRISIILSSACLLLTGCDSTGPELVDLSNVSVIGTQTGSVIARIDVNLESSYDIVMTGSGQYAYLLGVTPGPGIIAQIHCSDFSLDTTFDVGSGMILGYSLVPNEQDSRVYYCTVHPYEMLTYLEVPSGARGDTLDLAQSPVRGMAFRPGTGNLYVVHSDQIEVVDEDAMEVTATLDIGGRGPAFSVTGSELYLLSDDRDSLMLLDPSTGDIRASAGAGFPREFLCVCTVTRSGYVYAAITDPSLDTGGIYQLDAATLALSDSMISDWQYGWLCSIPGRDELYYYCSEAEGSNILVVSIPDLEIAGEAEQLIGLSGMCAHPSGDYVLCIVQYYGYRDSW